LNFEPAALIDWERSLLLAIFSPFVASMQSLEKAYYSSRQKLNNFAIVQE
jgi:hypothetical protein